MKLSEQDLLITRTFDAMRFQSKLDVSAVFIRPLSDCGTLVFHVKNNEV